jgi:hypothetical protein
MIRGRPGPMEADVRSGVAGARPGLWGVSSLAAGEKVGRGGGGGGRPPTPSPSNLGPAGRLGFAFCRIKRARSTRARPATPLHLHEGRAGAEI